MYSQPSLKISPPEPASPEIPRQNLSKDEYYRILYRVLKKETDEKIFNTPETRRVLDIGKTVWQFFHTVCLTPATLYIHPYLEIDFATALTQKNSAIFGWSELDISEFKKQLNHLTNDLYTSLLASDPKLIINFIFPQSFTNDPILQWKSTKKPIPTSIIISQSDGVGYPNKGLGEQLYCRFGDEVSMFLFTDTMMQDVYKEVLDISNFEPEPKPLSLQLIYESLCKTLLATSWEYKGVAFYRIYMVFIRTYGEDINLDTSIAVEPQIQEYRNIIKANPSTVDNELIKTRIESLVAEMNVKYLDYQRGIQIVKDRFMAKYKLLMELLKENPETHLPFVEGQEAEQESLSAQKELVISGLRSFGNSLYPLSVSDTFGHLPPQQKPRKTNRESRQRLDNQDRLLMQSTLNQLAYLIQSAPDTASIITKLTDLRIPSSNVEVFEDIARYKDQTIIQLQTWDRNSKTSDVFDAEFMMILDEIFRLNQLTPPRPWNSPGMSPTQEICKRALSDETSPEQKIKLLEQLTSKQTLVEISFTILPRYEFIGAQLFNPKPLATLPITGTLLTKKNTIPDNDSPSDAYYGMDYGRKNGTTEHQARPNQRRQETIQDSDLIAYLQSYFQINVQGEVINIEPEQISYRNITPEKNLYNRLKNILSCRDITFTNIVPGSTITLPLGVTEVTSLRCVVDKKTYNAPVSLETKQVAGLLDRQWFIESLTLPKVQLPESGHIDAIIRLKSTPESMEQHAQILKDAALNHPNSSDFSMVDPSVLGIPVASRLYWELITARSEQLTTEQKLERVWDFLSSLGIRYGSDLETNVTGNEIEKMRRSFYNAEKKQSGNCQDFSRCFYAFASLLGLEVFYQHTDVENSTQSHLKIAVKASGQLLDIEPQDTPPFYEHIVVDPFEIDWEFAKTLEGPKSTEYKFALLNNYLDSDALNPQISQELALISQLFENLPYLQTTSDIDSFFAQKSDLATNTTLQFQPHYSPATLLASMTHSARSSHYQYVLELIMSSDVISNDLKSILAQIW